MNTCSTSARVLLFVCACVCIQGPLARAASTTLPLRSDFTTEIFHNRVSRTLSTAFGSSVFAETFTTTGSATYDFYSTPLTSSTTLQSGDNAGGQLWMKNLGTLAANDFRVTGTITFFDYNPSTGNQTLILASGTSSAQTVPHDMTRQFTVPPAGQLNSPYTVPAGHLLKASVTIAFVDGNPTPDGLFLYNGASGQTGDSVARLPQSQLRTWTFGTPTGPYVTFSASTAAGGTPMTSANQITVNLHEERLGRQRVHLGRQQRDRRR